MCSWLRFSRLQGRRKGSGFRGQKQSPPRNPSGSSGHSWGALAHSERPLEQSIPPGEDTPVPLTALPGGGNQRGINRLTHNIVITCRQGSKLLAADCCLTVLLTSCSLSSSYLREQLRIFKLLSYFTEYWTGTYGSLANTQDTADNSESDLCLTCPSPQKHQKGL